MTDRSWADFLSMGGYALYVWGSYLVTLLAIGGEVLLLVRRKKSATELKNSSHRQTNQ